MARLQTKGAAKNPIESPTRDALSCIALMSATNGVVGGQPDDILYKPSTATSITKKKKGAGVRCQYRDLMNREDAYAPLVFGGRTQHGSDGDARRCNLGIFQRPHDEAAFRDRECLCPLPVYALSTTEETLKVHMVVVQMNIASSCSDTAGPRQWCSVIAERSTERRALTGSSRQFLSTTTRSLIKFPQRWSQEFH